MTHKNIQIKPIKTKDVLPIRHKVMWPNMPINYVSIENDKDARHFGLFINEELVSVISLFVKNKQAQFRKFATLTKYQGLGYGSFLLKHIITLVKEEKLKKLWCNARVEKSKFYTKFNLKVTDKRFVKGGIDYVIMETFFQ
ncbi:GNAT family N-acetyltransferase [uncultured Tenacibaculum sp.]|uniref:GNAT family N-acetyltransferase n=1 Tax=uncultured Tenacibaculum sp. TaxID=174713 RepID=UPI00262D8623|nr:GNAT family N-acetyltransferase [uncultured Tenacibaculum sp.]